MFSRFTSTSRLWTNKDVEPIKGYISDWLKCEMEENEKRKREMPPTTASLSLQSPIHVLWMAAEEFGVSPHVKYRALEIFMRFIKSHVVTLSGHVTNTTKPGKDRTNLLQEVARRVSQQAPLRAFSCLMIASKITSHKKILGSQHVRKLLKKVGRVYTISSVLRSERRILEEIKFRCLETSTALEVVGLIVAAVLASRSAEGGQQDQLSAEGLYEAAMTMLDFAFIKHEEVYLQLYASVTDSKIIPRKHKAAFLPVVQDRILLAGSVVMGGAWLMGGDEEAEAVGGVIANLTDTPLKDLGSLSSSILYLAGSFSWGLKRKRSEEGEEEQMRKRKVTEEEEKEEEEEEEEVLP